MYIYIYKCVALSPRTVHETEHDTSETAASKASSYQSPSCRMVPRLRHRLTRAENDTLRELFCFRELFLFLSFGRWFFMLRIRTNRVGNSTTLGPPVQRLEEGTPFSVVYCSRGTLPPKMENEHTTGGPTGTFWAVKAKRREIITTIVCVPSLRPRETLAAQVVVD